MLNNSTDPSYEIGRALPRVHALILTPAAFLRGLAELRMLARQIRDRPASSTSFPALTHPDNRTL